MIQSHDFLGLHIHEIRDGTLLQTLQTMGTSVLYGVGTRRAVRALDVDYA